MRDRIKALLAIFNRVWQGEPLRVVNYAAVVIVYVVGKVLVATGVWTDAPSLETIVVAVGAGIVAITEFVRQYVTPYFESNSLVRKP